MKSILSLCLVAGSALVASKTLTNTSNKTISGRASFFTCNMDGKAFTATTNDSSLATIFTYADQEHKVPAALFMNAEETGNSSKSYLYIQPINDDAPADELTVNNNLYKEFYVTYKAADNTFYNTTNAPGNLEITAIDTVHRMINGKLNCILYSSTKKDWLIVTNGRFRLKF